MTIPNGALRIESLTDAGAGGVAARLAALPADVRQVHRAVLRAFLDTGRAPHPDELPLPPRLDRQESFHRLDAADLVHLDADGHVGAAYPFSRRPTGHLVRLDDGPAVWAMCAIDALGIPLMAHRDAAIVSADPGDGQPIRIERRGDAWRWSPAETVVLLAQTNGCGPAADCLCPAITFHTDRERAAAHLRSRRELTGLVLDQVRALDIAGWSFGPLLNGEGDRV